MATWDELGRLTWDDMQHVTWDQAARLTAEEIQAFVVVALAAVSTLTRSELDVLAAGVEDRTLVPGWSAEERRDAPDRDVARAGTAARRIWAAVKPRDRAEAIAYLALLLSLVQTVQGAVPAAERPLEVRVEVTTPAQSEPSPNPSPSASTPLPDVQEIPLAQPSRAPAPDSPIGA